ncbi:Nitrogen regulatory protein P-II [Legionella busanensis]|uniref:Nitrogen regulatory protein P-II n=1 Tax=Legionella busanensis TaxID=190655 RepID=A0A378KD90_9GAMM|nr:P-II family nitrogen regulator [Legionella busanensis]STX81192.1 Nitrogen regulatory protein P-II [Legionella busanensis]STX81293.1 Nitrogen regulatory protein P-II [Legionella busanensis]
MSIINVYEKRESGISLHPMKKIEVIVSGDNEQRIAKMMNEANVPGFTLLRNISGKGHHGFHEGKLLFNDKAALVMFIAVAPEEAIATIALGMKTLFQKNSGVMFVSDVSVARLDYFT